ncbi:unnamed protein product [Staurois parvus]|uniref:Uncharacterized protein n=1 Tax=Staurois parvus TaxID=386267 RepID=A0ABN9DG00_9NEOB|nr:unnamed protein product [Staurois parvus]
MEAMEDNINKVILVMEIKEDKTLGSLHRIILAMGRQPSHLLMDKTMEATVLAMDKVNQAVMDSLHKDSLHKDRAKHHMKASHPMEAILSRVQSPPEEGSAAKSHTVTTSQITMMDNRISSLMTPMTSKILDKSNDRLMGNNRIKGLMNLQALDSSSHFLHGMRAMELPRKMTIERTQAGMVIEAMADPRTLGVAEAVVAMMIVEVI